MVNSSEGALVEDADQTNDELPAGTKLSNGTYTIVKHLKSGGFGITYLATDTLGRKVVIKECFPSGICKRASQMVKARSRIYVPNVASLIDRFVVEAHSLARLSHPNIVKVHQVFKENETAYMALDYVEGHDLLDVMANSSLALTPAGVRSTLVKLLDAVGTVHETGLLHRDISPDNILIDSKRNPVLIDFGAAREQDRSATSAASTLHVVKDGYSPQELYLSGGGDQGPWSDLYSLAASFYHVVSGEPPANSQARLAALASNTDDPVVPLAGRFDDYDDAFLAAIDKAMSVLPKQRMQSARQWLSAINGGSDDLEASKPEPSRVVTPMTRVTRLEADAARKKIGPLAILGGVAVVALVVTGVFLAMPDGSGSGSVTKTAAIGKASAATTAAAPAAAEA
ncbi:MAG TPA: serine/threonine-protein kinase, partial [Tabrizicola sp.]|nr:serine/threonine-protein kinase [Tabrizicola sp.]